MSNLPYKIVRRLPQDLLSKQEPYNAVKALVVKETDLSEYQWSEKLLALTALGEQ